MNPPSLHEFDDPKSNAFLSEDVQYKVRPAMNSAYKSASRRFLCVWGSVPTNALRTGSLLEKSATKKSFDNLFSVIPQALNLDDDTGFMLVNFNHARTAGKTESEQNTLMVQFTKRIEYFIEKYKPTDIIVFGDGPAARIWFGSDTTPNRDELPMFTAMRGNVRKHPKHKLRFTYTFDIEYLCRNSEADDASREDTALVDLLYMVSRHMDNAFAGGTQFSASTIKPNPIFVDSISVFDDLMSKLESNRVVAYDCETANLSSYSNTLLTSQFAVTPTEGYIVPHKHKDTPKVFDAKQRRYVNQSLHAWFSRTPKKGAPLPILVGTNLQFDLRIARVFYGLNFIFNNVWDITAGESLLDENTGILDKATFPDYNNESRKTTMGNLRNMACGYGNPLYYTLPFSKEQRLTIASVDIVGDKAKDVWDYMTLDVQLPLRIMELQLERALYVEQTQGLHGWQDLYKKHVSRQMNNTIHAISHMHQHGSYIDTDYLSKLADKRKSPLIGEIQEIEKRIQSSEVVTSFLLKSSTKPGSKSGQAGGLFASVGKSDTAFDINKPANKKAIFFGEDYLNLTPINVSKITKEPAVDKLLFSTYKHTVPLAADYADWTILNKFLSTYVNSWNESLQDDLDGSKDGCLRPSFGFFNVVTGRLNSFKPSLHQIPSRASTAKKIKKAFIAKPGMLQVKWDFSAHEVRMWGNEAYDPGIGELFRIGQRLRQEFIVTMDPEKKALLMKEMKTKGDVHVANVARFFGVWVSKDDPLRDAVKAVIFG